MLTNFISILYLSSLGFQKTAEAPIIEPGSEEIKISVTLEYEIK